MKLVLLASLLCLSAWVCAESQEPAPAPAPATPEAKPVVETKPEAKPEKTPAVSSSRRTPRWQDGAWLTELNGLRSLPRAGDIENGSVSATVSDVFDMDDATRAGIEKIMAAHDAALIEAAKRWNREAESLRAEYEKKIVALIPEARREAAAKVLDFSHKHWTSAFEREEQFRREYTERRIAADRELQQAGKDMDKRKEVRQQMEAWVVERRRTLLDPARQALAELKGMLAPEEAARLELHDRARPIARPRGTAPALPPPTRK